MRYPLSMFVYLFVLAFFPLFAVLAAPVDPLRTDVLEKFDAPDGKSTSVNVSPKAFVEASTDKTTATATLAKQIVVLNGDEVLNVGLTATTPFDGSKDYIKDLGSISGLTTGTSARLDLGGLYWPKPSLPSLQAVDAVCNDYVKRLLPGYHWSTDPAVITAEDRTASEHNVAKVWKGQSCFVLLTPDGLTKAIAAVNTAAAAESLPAVAAVAGADEILSEGLQKLGEANRATLHTAYSLTLSLTANRQSFSFSSPTTPTQINNENKNGKGVSATFSVITGSAVLGIGASYEKTFTAAQAVQVCSPIGSTGSTQCSSSALKAPAENADKLIFVEYRSVFGNNAVGISPRVEYKTNTSDVGVALPIYLAKNRQRILDGGLSLGWTKSDHFAASVFVGKAFSFFN